MTLDDYLEEVLALAPDDVEVDVDLVMWAFEEGWTPEDAVARYVCQDEEATG